jgi:hypothetical protein
VFVAADDQREAIRRCGWAAGSVGGRGTKVMGREALAPAAEPKLGEETSAECCAREPKGVTCNLLQGVYKVQRAACRSSSATDALRRLPLRVEARRVPATRCQLLQSQASKVGCFRKPGHDSCALCNTVYVPGTSSKCRCDFDMLSAAKQMTHSLLKMLTA